MNTLSLIQSFLLIVLTIVILHQKFTIDDITDTKCTEWRR